MTAIRRLAAAFVVLALGLLGCSGNPPHITRVSAQLLYVRDLATGRVSQELAVFVVPEDKDGLDDLEYLHVISDKAELYWTLESGAWTQIKNSNGEWVGSARLAVPPNEAVPRGEYRVMLYDLAGDSDEQRFSLEAEAVDPAEITFPQATESEGRITITGVSDWYTLLVYTGSGTFVKSFAAQARGIDVQSIRRADSALRLGFSYYLYGYWPRKNVGLLAGPYSVE